MRRTWAHLAAAVRRPVDRFAARQALDARLADARIERVLGSRWRLGNAIDTAMDAILLARRTGTPVTQMDRCYERAVEPVVRDHDAAVRREAPRPAPSEVPENPATPPSPAQGAGDAADRSRGQNRNWRR